MTEHWASYFCNVNGKLASIFLDIHLRNMAPDPGRPWLLWVWVYFKKPRPDGLSSTEEFSTLCVIEDKLNESMKQGGRCVLGGRITTERRREFYYYGPNAHGFEAAIRAVFSSFFQSYEFDSGTQHDPQWNQYLNVLFPTDDDLQKILNRGVLDAMEKQGDQPALPREVMHWTYFPAEMNRSQFQAAIQGMGYRIEAESHFPKSENPYGLCFAKVQECTSQAINQSVLLLAKLSRSFRGEYDGWEAQVMSDDESKQPSVKPN